jgi:putative transposase
VSCRLLGVSRSGYYEWNNRPPSARDKDNELLLKHIEKVHAESRGSYGSPRVHAELTLGLGLVVNEKRVARLMRAAGIRGLYVRRRRGCTVRNPDAESAGDLVNRQFVADAPNRLWVTDITEHPTDEGKLYCAAVMDVYGRRIVGWSIAPHIRTELVLDALGMAIAARGGDEHVAGVIAHADRGSQYTANDYVDFCQDRKMRPSVGRTGVCWDNAVAESFWESLKRECLQGRVFATRAEARRAIFRWINWYNTTRLHSTLKHVPPLEWEQQYRQAS